jgi:hypothetical protein
MQFSQFIADTENKLADAASKAHDAPRPLARRSRAFEDFPFGFGERD